LIIYYKKIANGLSIGTKIGDLEWPWTAQWPSVRVISQKTADFGANCVKCPLYFPDH